MICPQCGFFITAPAVGAELTICTASVEMAEGWPGTWSIKRWDVGLNYQVGGCVGGGGWRKWRQKIRIRAISSQTCASDFANAILT